MDTLTCRPIATGDRDDFILPVGATVPTGWQALSDGTTSQYVFSSAAGATTVVKVAPLPADATVVHTVTLFARIAGDDVHQVRILVWDHGTATALTVTAVVPPDGGVGLYQVDVPTDALGHAWTVALYNAAQFGFQNAADMDAPAIVEELWVDAAFDRAATVVALVVEGVAILPALQLGADVTLEAAAGANAFLDPAQSGQLTLDPTTAGSGSLDGARTSDASLKERP